MTLYQHSQRPDTGMSEETRRPVSRRTLLRRSALGVAGASLASLLVACGEADDDEPAQDPTPDRPGPVGDGTAEGVGVDSDPLDSGDAGVDDEVDVVDEEGLEDETGD